MEVHKTELEVGKKARKLRKINPALKPKPVNKK
jgi:hypothetical protein